MNDISITLIWFAIEAAIMFGAWRIFDKIIFPMMIRKSMKEVSRNPKWITSKLQYYGFDNIDFVLYESRWDSSPHMCLNKEKTKLELWIDNDTSANAAEDIGRLALVIKIKSRCGLWFPEKPLHWLSIFCFMLDGGDIQICDVPLEKLIEKDKKPVDD